jgi:DMSO/TMAO reductase YedYZ molybdopterin-dependent catalytic subunit
MGEGFFSRGFRGRRRSQDTARPPGQYLEDGFPVLSAGPTPHTPLEEWDFSIVGELDKPKKWTWEEFKGPRHPGFWESLGYHNYGDPWLEQRYWGD